ncbi:autotransporter outer membrane beta-barrel domain-containing protein [Sphingomonas phyllosphaerae]|uniref:autotransporter outer membrane beta-barrel domain-containing protein n=1 Tax=Sphingomonas phyllosphaerae TaxID=257003 RepID=UPI000423A89E|nr:autotransporter outer membrane beta-barrel domain-containing protein [Sphingomonas phyllosphaerae]
MAVQRSVRLRLWSLALGTSIAAMGVATTAQAQCSPDPTVAYGETTCTGVDSNGLNVSTSGTRVIVRQGAVVTTASGDGAIFSTGPNASFTVNGIVDGGARAGLVMAASVDLYNSTTISVAAGGTIRGTQALLLRQRLPYGYTQLTPTILNAGALTGTAGAAILMADNSDFNSMFGMQITNTATGTIAGVGNAIDTTSILTLTNAGTINGSVVSRTTDRSRASTIDTVAGTINGDLLLGAGNDVLQARYNNGALVTGVTGAIDGGDGVDTVRVRFATDTTLGPLALPTGFERTGLSLASNATVTLSSAFTGPITVEGSGSVINNATLVGTTQVVTQPFMALESVGLINNGTLRTTAAGGVDLFAIDLRSGSFRNDGMIDAAGNGVRSSISGPFVNTGVLRAIGTAVSLFGSSFDNSGTIRSTDGVGAFLSGSYGLNWVNSGTIEGATIGAQLSSKLTNGGTISSAGTAVALDWYGVIDNLAGGRIVGGQNAIAPSSGYSSDVQSAVVANAGTIDGNVTLGRRPINIYYNDNYYFALPGGVLNGNLTLGGGDTLITELANSGAGAFAGISGTVSATESLLRYRVRANASAVPTLPTGFIKLGYDLFDGAALTLTGASTPLTFAGTGNVDISGDIVAGRDTAISTTTLRNAPGVTTIPPANALSIVSRGTLTLTRLDSMQYSNAAVAIGGEDIFTNAGTIRVIDRASPIYNPLTAIRGATIINDGTIAVGGATAIDAVTIINNGSIVQVAGERNAQAVANTYASFTLTNTGTIDVANDAVTGDRGMTVDNSGRIASTSGIAIGSQAYATGSIVNRLGGTIIGNGTAIRLSGGMLENAGTIDGSVDLGFSPFGRSRLDAIYVAQGGTIAGDLSFGDGDDTLVAYDDVTGVSGTIDGGAGINTYIYARTTSGIVTLGGALPTGFTVEGVRAVNADTQVTLAAAAPVTTELGLSGIGSIVNTATIGGMVLTDNDPWGNGAGADAQILASFTNQGQLNGGFRGSVGQFVNSATGTMTTQDTQGAAVRIAQAAAIDFTNAGTIDRGNGEQGALLYSDSAVTAVNDGTIVGRLAASVQNRTNAIAAQPLTVSLINRGTISDDGGSTAVELDTIDDAGGTSSVTLDNRGTIAVTGKGGHAVYLETYGFDGNGTPSGGTRQITLTNSGTIRANDGGQNLTSTYQVFNPATGQIEDRTETYTESASALNLWADAGHAITVVNTATGTIEATGVLSTAIVAGGTLDLSNAGTLHGGGNFTTAYGETVAGAIQAFDANDRIVNTGTIIGSIATGAGDDRIENYGTITGDVFLGDGDDTFLHRASATLTGTVDAGNGIDSLIIDGTGGGTVRAGQFINFERFSQIGNGAVDYVGAFQADTIGVSGGTVTVAAGETLSSAGAVTITGTDNAETVDNAGTITGAVALGAGNDTFVERAGSSVVGGVDGGAGIDTYRVALSGDRSGIGARSGFEQLAVTGSGTLGLTLDQSFDNVALAGTALALTLNGNTVGAVTGSDAAETLSVDSDLARVALGGGNDTLALGTATANGSYAGGAGSDALRFTANAPVTLAGNASGFETIALTGNALTVTGTLGASGETATLGDGAQTLTLANGGTIAGTIDLGAGNDSFSLAPGGTLAGTVAGGAGDDLATVTLAGARTLDAASLTGFETLASTGTGTLTLTGAQSYDQVLAGTDLTIASSGSLTTGTVRMDGGNERLTIAGGFAGAVDGGAGTDTIAVSGGSASAPVAFTNVTNVEAFGMSAGFTTVSGNASLGAVTLSGGRLVGLANSTLSASRFDVAAGATFGSAGTVNGNVNVAGILSPGASPGVMTVNGNVALASGSRALFELTPTISDKLVVNGAMSIASGTTLEIVPVGTLRAGTSYDLITASGGITGGFTTVSKPASLFGVIVQRADRIQLLGQFLTDARFSPQVARSIAYANATLAVQPATSTLFDSLPALVDASGASNARGFAQLTPEAYASATQLGVDHALSLTQVARGNGFATDREDAGAFTFAQTVGQWHTLQGDAAQGSNTARAQSYGFLGGVGYGDRTWMVGAFAGYLNGRQQIGALGARTRADGTVGGIHARYGADSGWGISASVLYDGGKARTDRALPGAGAVSGRYDLHSWVSDLAASYGLDTGDGWSLRPRVGVTYIRTTRAGVAEEGRSPFALQVARDRHVAGFADAGVTLARSDASDASFRPFVTLGARYQIEGQRADALAGYAGGGLGLNAVGAARNELVGTAAGGVGYRLPSGLDLFASASAQTGRDDHQETISAGVRLRF